MSATLDSLKQDHRNMTKLLDAFERQFEVFSEAGAPDYALMQATLEYCVDYPDKVHHPKEDLIWASLIKRDKDAVAGMGDLTRLHEELSALSHSINYALKMVLQEETASRDWVGTSARNFLNAYRAHMKLEDEQFFPAAERTLTKEDWKEIDSKYESLEDPLFDRREESRFESLRLYIEDLDELAKA